MIVNERESVNMVCPMGIGSTGCCVASKCMGWRYELVEDMSWSKSHSDTTWTPVPVKIPLIETGRGYCGLVYK